MWVPENLMGLLTPLDFYLPLCFIQIKTGGQKHHFIAYITKNVCFFRGKLRPAFPNGRPMRRR